MTEPVLHRNSDAQAASLPLASLFVGREAEMGWLGRRLDTAEAGHPQVVLVIGEAGIGKTRLLREFSSAARARGVEVWTGRGYEDLTVPFLPIIEALAPRLRDLPPAVEAALGQQASIVKEFASGGVRDTPMERQSSEDEKLRLFLAVSRAVVELALLGPTLIVFNDLHWVDQASLELFAHLVFTVADAAERTPLPLLMVGSTRPLAGEEQLARTVARFQREAICHTLEVGGLDEDNIRDLARGLGIERPSQRLVDALKAATNGNPLFIHEVVRRLVQRRAVAPGGLVDDETPLFTVPVPLPADVTSAITARLRDVGAVTRRILTIAAVLGDPFTVAALSAVGQMAEDVLLAILEEADAQGLLVTDGASFRFAHPLIRQVLYGELPVPARQRQHAQIAEALISRGGAATGDSVLELARHLIAAGPSAEPATVLVYAQTAGDRAFAGASWRDAARFYRAALAADDTMQRLGPRERSQLHFLAGQAHFRDQDAGPCLEQFELAVAGFAACGDMRGHARALAGRTRAEITLAAVPYGTLIDPAPLRAAAEAMATTDPALGGLLWAELAQVYWAARRTAEAEAAARHALAIGGEQEDHVLCAEASRSLWLAHSQVMQVREALASLEAGRAYARLHGEAWVESELVQREALTLVWLGRLDEAQARAGLAGELTRATHDWGEHSLTLGALVCVAVARGDFAAAEDHARQALVMYRRSGYPWAGPTALPALSCAHLLRGRWDDALAALDLLATPGELFAQPGQALLLLTHIFRTAVQVHAAQSDEARAVVTEPVGGIANAAAPTDADVYALGVYGALVDIADLTGDRSLAAMGERPLALAAEHGVVLASGWVFLVARLLGVAAMMARDWRRAEVHLDRALAQAEAMRARTELARAWFDYARMLVARGRQADRASAQALATRAAELASELGMAPLERDARRLAGRLAVAVSVTVPLSRRDRALLERFAHGCSDGEIARELGLRTDTVARAVLRLLRKLGLPTRDAAHQLVARPVPGAPLCIILFTDVEGSTALFDRWGDTAARAILREHDAIVRANLQRYAGVERKHTGDGVMASFTSVAGALDCAIAIQRALADRNARQAERAIQVRIGINAGEPIGEGDDIYGTSVNAAARICGHARAGQILVADVVRWLAAGKDVRFVDRGWFTLEGLSARYHLHEVRW